MHTIDQQRILKSYWFNLALILLIVNDFFLKSYYPGWLTGKLSDFTGLFVFALFWIALFPVHRFKISVLTALLFVAWKTPISSSFILVWNQFSPLRIGRTVDYWDLVALTVLPLALFIVHRSLKTIKISPVWSLMISAFAFGATSYEEEFDFKKNYPFEMSKLKLVQSINQLTSKSQLSNLPISLHSENANFHSLIYEDTIWYYTSGNKQWYDTLYSDVTKTKIDSIVSYQTPILDSVYIGKNGVLYYNFSPKKYMQESRTGYCESVPAKLIINGDRTSSSLTLLKIITANCMGVFEREAKKSERSNLRKAFETEVIEKL